MTVGSFRRPLSATQTELQLPATCRTMSKLRQQYFSTPSEIDIERGENGGYQSTTVLGQPNRLSNRPSNRPQNGPVFYFELPYCFQRWDASNQVTWRPCDHCLFRSAHGILAFSESYTTIKFSHVRLAHMDTLGTCLLLWRGAQRNNVLSS